MEFTTREIASGIIFVAFIVLAVGVTKDRAPLRRAFLGFVGALAAWKVWTVILAYLVFVTGVVLVAHSLGFWSTALLKETLMIGFFVGLPILFNGTNFKNISELAQHVVKEVLGVAALLVVYINLATFPLWGELLLQTCVLLFVMFTVIGKSNPETAPAGKFFEGLTSFIVLSLVVYVSVQLVTGSSGFDWEREITTFALSVWLPFSLIPFIYLFGLVASCETALVRAKVQYGSEKLLLRVRFAFLLGIRGSLRYASSFTGSWLANIASNKGFRETLRTMHEYRESVRTSARRNRERRRRLKRNSGAEGIDQQGLWLDRREFFETKEALEHLYYSQMGLYRHRGGRYWTDPVVIFPPSGFKDLPEDHGIDFRVRDDGQAWFAWRRTTGGFYLGVGGTQDVEAQWRYAGTEPPISYPSPEAAEWVDISGGTHLSPEWHTDDGPHSPA